MVHCGAGLIRVVLQLAQPRRNHHLRVHLLGRLLDLPVDSEAEEQKSEPLAAWNQRGSMCDVAKNHDCSMCGRRGTMAGELYIR